MPVALYDEGVAASMYSDSPRKKSIFIFVFKADGYLFRLLTFV